MPDAWDNYVKKKKKKRNAANTLATFVNSSNTKLAILDDLVYEDEPAAPPSGIIGSLASGAGAAIGAIGTVTGDILSALGAATSSAGSALGAATRRTGSAIRATGSKAKAKASEMWPDLSYVSRR